MISNEKLYEYAINIIVNEVDGYNSYVQLNKLLDALKANIREESVKKQGTKVKTYKIVEKVLKSAAKVYNKSHSFATSMQPWNEYECFLDGHRLIADKKTKYGYEAAEEPFDISRLLSNLENYTQEIKVDKVDLETFAKLHKKDDVPYKLEYGDNGFILCNPHYLLDSINFTENFTVYINPNLRTSMTDTSPKPWRSPILSFDDVVEKNRIAYLLPINPPRHMVNNGNNGND